MFSERLLCASRSIIHGDAHKYGTVEAWLVVDAESDLDFIDGDAVG